MIRRVSCVDVSQTASNEEVWKAVRTIYGPVPIYTLPTDIVPSYQLYADLMNSDIMEYNGWVAATGHSSVSFKKWLIWYISHGTTNYNNLRTNKVSNKVGRIYAPCPYDTESSDQRCIDMLGEVPTKVVHEFNSIHYYMEANSRGSKWGWQCTFEGCPYNISNGKKYFYI